MKDNGIVWGMITKHDDHEHLEWICPDCRGWNYVGEDGSRRYRFTCARTGREFLVVGLRPSRAAGSLED